MSGPDEIAEMEEELRVLKAQNADYCKQVKLLREVNADLGRSLGLMEAQRNHARWKYGRARSKWRAHREVLQAQIAHLRELYHASSDFKALTLQHIALQASETK